jgi:cytochrome c556
MREQHKRNFAIPHTLNACSFIIHHSLEGDCVKKVLLAQALAATLGLAAALPAAAQFAKPEDAQKYRQSALSVMAAHFGRVGAMANGRAPFDAKAAQDNMAIVEMMSKLPWAGFTGGQQGGKAKANIWTDQAKFKTASDNMMAEVAKLSAAAKTATNADGLKAAFGAAAGTCKACHDDFRDN